MASALPRPAPSPARRSYRAEEAGSWAGSHPDACRVRRPAGRYCSLLLHGGNASLRALGLLPKVLRAGWGIVAARRPNLKSTSFDRYMAVRLQQVRRTHSSILEHVLIRYGE